MTSIETSKSLSWAPLQRPLFRDRWVASIISNLGSWMQDTAGAWLMISLTTSPLLIALMQTAASLPTLLLGMLAGATADVFDRRRLLIFWQIWMLAVAIGLSGLTLTGGISPWMLLSLTFLLSLGNAMSAPAWQAIVPELVPRTELPTAISLNSAGFNLARALGPALGGILVAAVGAGSVFLLNAVSFVAVIFVLYRWRRQPLYTSTLPTERMIGAMRAGLRYVHFAPVLQAILIRAFAPVVCVSAVWALLPLVAQQELKLGALGYGLLNGCLGAGSVLGAALLPKLRQRLSTDRLVQIAVLVFSITLVVLAYVHSLPLVVITLLASGIAWISMASSFNIAVQTSVPAWVQARALGIYQTVFIGGLAIGSIVWGTVANITGTSTALLCAAIGLIAGLPLAWRFRLMTGAKSDLTPALHWAEPHVVIELRPDDGPVLVTVEYDVNRNHAQEFTVAMQTIGAIRRRDGAIRWGIFHDIENPHRFVETFVVESWLEHLRQHERFTKADRLLEQRIHLLLRGEPIVAHMMYARPQPPS